MKADVLLRLATVIVPGASRQRMVEEWAADLAGCAEVGVSPRGIAVGALRVASAARAHRFLTVSPQVRRVASAALIGLLLGAICAVGDIPVLTVAVVAAAFEARAVDASLRRRRAQLNRVA